jgi:hypothetical protein
MKISECMLRLRTYYGISKLEKRELDIEKESSNAEEVIEDAIEHVNLILEDRQGKISTHLELCKNSIGNSPFYKMDCI